MDTNLAYVLPDNDDDLDQVPEIHEGFVIDNAEKAGWALRTIKTERAIRDQKVEPLEKRIKALQARIGAIQQEIRRYDVAFEARELSLKGMLRGYFEIAVKRELKASWRVPLPDGTLILTKPSETLIHDDDKLLPYVKKSHPQFVKIKETVDWAGLKSKLNIRNGVAIIPTTGEIPDGVTVSEKPSMFDIDF